MNKIELEYPLLAEAPVSIGSLWTKDGYNDVVMVCLIAADSSVGLMSLLILRKMSGV